MESDKESLESSGESQRLVALVASGCCLSVYGGRVYVCMCMKGQNCQTFVINGQGFLIHGQTFVIHGQSFSLGSFLIHGQTFSMGKVS